MPPLQIVLAARGSEPASRLTDLDAVISATRPVQRGKLAGAANSSGIQAPIPGEAAVWGSVATQTELPKYV